MKKILIDGEYVSPGNVYEYNGLVFVYDCIYDRIHVYKKDDYIDYFDILDAKNISNDDFKARCTSYALNK